MATTRSGSRELLVSGECIPRDSQSFLRLGNGVKFFAWNISRRPACQTKPMISGSPTCTTAVTGISQRVRSLVSLWFFGQIILAQLRNKNWLVVSKIFHVHPYVGKIHILTNIFQMGWNHQLENLWSLFFPQSWSEDDTTGIGDFAFNLRFLVMHCFLVCACCGETIIGGSLVY